MRPNISGALEGRIEERIDDSSFDSAGEYIRYCVRRELEEEGGGA